MNKSLVSGGGSLFRSARSFLQEILYLRTVVDEGGQEAIDYTREYIDFSTLCAEGEHPLLSAISRLHALSRVLVELRDAVGARQYALWAALESRPGTESMRAAARRLGVADRSARRMVEQTYIALEGLLGERRWLAPRTADELPPIV